MLRHVHLQQQVVERLQRRGDRDQQRRDAGEERREPPRGEASRHLPMHAREAARVERGYCEQHRDRENRRRPHIESGLY